MRVRWTDLGSVRRMFLEAVSKHSVVRDQSYTADWDLSPPSGAANGVRRHIIYQSPHRIIDGCELMYAYLRLYTHTQHIPSFS